MKKWILGLCLMNISYALVVSYPDLSVISAQKPQVQLTVLNNGDKRAYVSMENETYSCDSANDMFACSEQKVVKDQSKESYIRFSNSKFLLDPGQKRNIFIFWSGDLPEKLTMFNVWAKDNSPDALKTIKRKANKATIEINVLTVNKVRMVVAPKNTQNSKPTISQSANNVTIKNTGSAPLLLKYREMCGDKVCSDRRVKQLSRNILGNGSQSIKLYEDRVLSIQYFDYQRQAWKEVFNSQQKQG